MMKLNGIKIRISTYTSEVMGIEMVLYNEEGNKIIIFNHSAMAIWDEITNNYIRDTDLLTEDIVASLKTKYEIYESESLKVGEDVNEMINMLFQSSLLKKMENETGYEEVY